MGSMYTKDLATALKSHVHVYMYTCVCVCVFVCVRTRKILQPLSKVSYEETSHTVYNAKNIHVHCVCSTCIHGFFIYTCTCKYVYMYMCQVSFDTYYVSFDTRWCVCMCVYVYVHEGPGNSAQKSANKQMMTRHACVLLLECVFSS